MNTRPRRDTVGKVDYAQLAGMSGKSKTKSVKSVKSIRSEKSVKKSDKGLNVQDDLTTLINKDADEGFGKTILDQPLPGNLEEDDEAFKKVMDEYEKEQKQWEERQIKLDRRQQAIDARKRLAEMKRQTEAKAWSQKLQMEAMALKEQEEAIAVLEEEETLKQRRANLNRRVADMKAKELDDQIPTEDNAKRTEEWLEKNPVEKVTEENRELKEKDEKVKLEKELKRLKALDPRGAPPSSSEAFKQLKEMGLMPMNIQEEELSLPGQIINPRPEELKKMGLQQETGKPLQLMQCMGCSGIDKSKLKSGKYVKSNINIKVQEQWPHLNVLRKYCKRTTFDQLEFETFVAGEVKIISNIHNNNELRARLDFLMKISHWLCRCRDWPLVRGLYEAVLESIELGEETWFSDFSHYESMVPNVIRQDIKEIRIPTIKSKDRMEIYWCKMYQRNSCLEKSPHMAQLKPDEPPIPVVHCCAHCLQKDNRRMEHPESECPGKKS